MLPLTIRDATAADHDAIVRLNLESEELLSPMDERHLVKLDRLAAYHRVTSDGPDVVGFLLALRDGAAYDSLNYRWFSQRYDTFLYVDRVVFSSSHRGRGLGTAMYENLFAFAREHGIQRIACELYVVPLNEASQAFHAKLGFSEVGRQRLPDSGKQVSLQVANA
jgi:uncharacterized protein